MQKQIFYIYKFKSSRLKEFNYDITLTFDEAQKNKEVISLFDSQLLRSIRFLKEETFDNDKLKSLKETIERYKKNKHSKENSRNIHKTQQQINNMLFVPEIISIVMESKEDYKYLYKNYLKLNGKLYRRLSCSAGQARISNVLFCEIEMADKLDEIFDNGRNKDKELVPSKYNAYKGLISSSTSVVSTPRFCVVPDYESETEVTVNFVTETADNQDEIIEITTYKELFNRFDGQGLISVELAKKWADELELDYVPSQWCVRQNYLKGMVTVFDIKDFCKKKNNGNYIIETSYTDKEGNKVKVDLREVDLIISESMFKLWDSWDSVEAYQENCKKNGLEWGVSLVNPKKDKDILRMNYQFLQTTDLSDDQIEDVCSKFVNWIEGVNSKNIYHTILFLLGTDVDEDKIMKYMDKSDNYWVKTLIVNPKLIHDKWIKKKIYDLMKNKIKKGCLGQVLVDGNFQVIVSDPYAQMQHICGHKEITGLLNKQQHYSNYWNEKGIEVVDSMRAPLTYRSEHVLLNLQKTEEMEYWYIHNTSGIIVNIHGDETMRWAGSDFDMDIIATTSDKNIINGVYQDELPIAYSPPKAEKKKFKDRDLFNADLHSFGSEIGQITNKSTSGFALLSQLEEDTKEYEVTMNRIISCTKFQSSQIDKAKIGRKVKSTPNTWQKYNYINKDTDTPEVIENKKFLNSILLNKHPYFFTYLYKNTRQKYKRHFQNEDITCRQKFGISLEELKNKKQKTTEQRNFLKSFYEKSPVIDSDCVMNKICRHIESIDFGIRNIIKNDCDDEVYKILMNGDLSDFNENKYKKILNQYDKYKSISSTLASNNSDNENRDDFNEDKERDIESEYQILENSLIEVCSDIYELVDYLIYMFYVDKTTYNKEVLWSVFGKYIFENVKNKVDSYKIPVPCEYGEIDYLNKKYTIKEVMTFV